MRKLNSLFAVLMLMFVLSTVAMAGEMNCPPGDMQGPGYTAMDPGETSTPPGITDTPPAAPGDTQGSSLWSTLVDYLCGLGL